MSQRITHTLIVLTLLVVLFTAFKTTEVNSKMQDQPALSGQSFTSHGVTTERFMGESKEVFLVRHMEIVNASEED